MNDLDWEILYLERNQQPTDNYGRELEAIRAPNSGLKDSHIQKLATALQKNSVFRGGLDLEDNHLTDLSLLYLTKSLQASSCLITFLNLSYNNLKPRSGIYIGDLLSTGYKLRELYLKGCCLDSMGVQRIVENVEDSTLKILDIGILNNSGLAIISKYLPRINKLKYLKFQQGNPWSEGTMREVVESMNQNYSLLYLDILNCDKSEFVEEMNSVTDRNQSLYLQQKNEKRQAESLNPKAFAEEIQGYIEKSIQNLPIRVYLNNSLGTLINDGIYQLMKFRFKENQPPRNTAVNNVKWLIRYILDNTKN
jgi:hypothetical protein